MSLTLSALRTITLNLEGKAGASTAANDTEAGYWRRIAAAAEAVTATSSTANQSMDGYMLRATKALEASAGTAGTSINYSGLLRRMAVALEGKAGATYTGQVANRLILASANATFAPPGNPLSSALTDNFNDNAIGAQWTVGHLYDIPAITATIAETGGELRISTTADGYSGLLSATDRQLDSVYAKALATPIAGQVFFLTFGTNNDNRVGVLFDGGQAYLQMRSGGTGANYGSFAFDLAAQPWLRLRHNPTGDTINVDSAPDNAGAPGTWTNRISTARPTGFSVAAGKVNIGGGAYSFSNTTLTRWDGLNTAV